MRMYVADGRESVFESCGKWVLGRESVFHRRHATRAGLRERTRDRRVRVDRTRNEPAAVKIHQPRQRFARRIERRVDPNCERALGAWNRPFFGTRDRRFGSAELHEFGELSATLRNARVKRIRRVPRSQHIQETFDSRVERQEDYSPGQLTGRGPVGSPPAIGEDLVRDLRIEPRPADRCQRRRNWYGRTRPARHEYPTPGQNVPDDN